MPITVTQSVVPSEKIRILIVEIALNGTVQEKEVKALKTVTSSDVLLLSTKAVNDLKTSFEEGAFQAGGLELCTLMLYGSTLAIKVLIRSLLDDVSALTLLDISSKSAKRVRFYEYEALDFQAGVNLESIDSILPLEAKEISLTLENVQQMSIPESPPQGRFMSVYGSPTFGAEVQSTPKCRFFLEGIAAQPSPPAAPLQLKPCDVAAIQAAAEAEMLIDASPPQLEANAVAPPPQTDVMDPAQQDIVPQTDVMDLPQQDITLSPQTDAMDLEKLELQGKRGKETTVGEQEKELRTPPRNATAEEKTEKAPAKKRRKVALDVATTGSPLSPDVPLPPYKKPEAKGCKRKVLKVDEAIERPLLPYITAGKERCPFLRASPKMVGPPRVDPIFAITSIPEGAVLREFWKMFVQSKANVGVESTEAVTDKGTERPVEGTNRVTDKGTERPVEGTVAVTDKGTDRPVETLREENPNMQPAEEVMEQSPSAKELTRIEQLPVPDLMQLEVVPVVSDLDSPMSSCHSAGSVPIQIEKAVHLQPLPEASVLNGIKQFVTEQWKEEKVVHFSDVAPKQKTSKIQASRAFSALLYLHKKKVVELNQDKAYGEIQINRPSTG